MLITNTKNTGLFRPRDSELITINRILDGLIIWSTLNVLCIILKVEFTDAYWRASFLAIILYLIIAELRGIYNSSHLSSYGSYAHKQIYSWISVAIVLSLLAFITKSSAIFSRLAIGNWLIITPILMSIVRLLLNLISKRLGSSRTNKPSYAVLGNKKTALHLHKKLSALTWIDLINAGNYEKLEDLLSLVHSSSINYVFIECSESQKVNIAHAINSLANTTVSVYLVPNIFYPDIDDSTWITVGNIPMVMVNDHPFYGARWLIKKFIDLLLSALILLLISPLLVCIALAVKLSSPGTILFKQRRYGLNGEVIQVLKFRTMRTMDDGAVVVQASKDDPRITPLGRILRKTSLDELPQFWNVLQGTMSIVGPRPHAIAHNEEYRQLIEGYMLRHKVKPGITGWAQVNGFRGETETLDKMKSRIDYDLYYINHWSIWFDLKIILMTIVNGFTGKTAY
jgi:putative colanic acid biosynthesis UDP-glucose lipid carrier transferase